MTVALDEIWAKSPKESEERGESLQRHTELVVCALCQLMELRPDLPVTLSCPRFWHWAYWACCFHDLGKCAAGFQAQLRQTDGRWGHRHEVLSLAFLPWVALPQEDRLWVAAAIVSHHRDASFISGKYPLDVPAEYDALTAGIGDVPRESIPVLYQWMASSANARIDQHQLTAFGVEPLAFVHAGSQVPSAETARELLERFTRLTGATRAQDGTARWGLELRGTVVMADRLGSAHAPPLRAMGLSREVLLATMERQMDELYPHQTAAGEAHGDVILVAPTGSGKTEAALLWGTSKDRRVAPRLLYMLPYQASINAMHGRLSKYTRGRVGIQHGRSLHALYQRLLEDEPNPKVAAAIAVRERALTRLNHPPVRVLTPYQILRACYRLKGYEAILADLQGALVVVDEIHAYEPKRLAMILGMAGYLKREFGTRWFVMSATLPSVVRAAIDRALGDTDNIVAQPEIFEAFRRHILRVVEGEVHDGRNLDQVLAAANVGSVLVCCNTVVSAQRAHKALVDLQGDQGRIPVTLLHGRFNSRDRSAKEIAISRDVSVGAGARGAAQILVATQVIEVSLNLSFDTIFTEPAPLDALLQRFGRVNRIPSGALRPVHVFSGPTDGQHVYSAAHLTRTMEILRREVGLPIDEARTSIWLDEIFSDGIASEWQAEYEDALVEFESATIRRLVPFQSDDQLRELFYRVFDAIEILPACLETQFDRENEDKPIEAAELLVSVPFYVVEQLKPLGRVRDDGIRVIDVPYDSAHGLQIPRR